MKWYSIKKYIPCHTGDLIIFRLKSGFVQTGIFDYQKEIGYHFNNDDAGIFELQDITHFCIPDPIEIEK